MSLIIIAFFNLKKTTLPYSIHSSILVNGNYTSWSAWKECSATCGGGIQERSRTCTNPKPRNGGQDCVVLGAAAETRSCNSQPCPSKSLAIMLKFKLSHI